MYLKVGISAAICVSLVLSLTFSFICLLYFIIISWMPIGFLRDIKGIDPDVKKGGEELSRNWEEGKGNFNLNILYEKNYFHYEKSQKDAAKKSNNPILKN